MIAIIDYGMGNLKSVGNALKKLDIPYIITADVEVIKEAKGLILPGVGAFGDAMKNIKNISSIIREKVSEGCPILGICLGMQMLYERGFENGEEKGLGLLTGEIKLIEPKYKVKIPHIGWNNLKFVKLVGDCPQHVPYMYFVHSYCANNIAEDEVIAYSEYGGIRIPALVKRDNVLGAQFHPEKSGEAGLKILEEFWEMVR